MDQTILLQCEQNIAWLPGPNEGRLVLSPELPPRELCTTALVLAFSRDALLQTHLVKRGWDLVGGHIEAGETPEEAIRRESYEEAAARLGSLHLLGYQHLRLFGPCPPTYRYPYPESYQIFYWAHLRDLEPFVASQESDERALFSPSVARTLPWVQAHLALYEIALNRALQSII